VMWGVLARREGLNAMRDEGRAGPLGGRAGWLGGRWPAMKGALAD
jgi:hypothetical protein